MNIKLHCEHCGASVQAPREMAGRMSNCPACKNTLYVPTPEEELEELPLAPEDSLDLRREAQLLEERRRLDSLLAHETRAGDEVGGRMTSDSSARAGGRPMAGDPVGGAGGGAKIEAAVTRYLVAMRNSDFDGAERALATMKLQPRTAREIIDRLAADPMPPMEMAQVPSGVFQGFLKTLRSRL